MAKIQAICSKINSLESIIEEVVSTVENLDFDWCKEPVKVYITLADNEGRTTPAKFDVLVENELGYFGFSIF